MLSPSERHWIRLKAQRIEHSSRSSRMQVLPGFSGVAPPGVEPAALRMARINEDIAELQDMLEMTIRDMDAQQAEAALELQRMRARLLDGLCPSKLRRSERLKGLARRLAMLEQNVGREQAECVKVMEAVLATVERNGAVAEAVCQHLSGIATTRATTAAQMLPDPNIHQELAAKAAEVCGTGWSPVVAPPRPSEMCPKSAPEKFTAPNSVPEGDIGSQKGIVEEVGDENTGCLESEAANHSFAACGEEQMAQSQGDKEVSVPDGATSQPLIVQAAEEAMLLATLPDVALEPRSEPLRGETQRSEDLQPESISSEDSSSGRQGQHVVVTRVSVSSSDGASSSSSNSSSSEVIEHR